MADFLDQERRWIAEGDRHRPKNRQRHPPRTSSRGTKNIGVGRIDIPFTNRQIHLPRVAGIMGATGTGLIVASSLLGGGKADAGASLPFEVKIEPRDYSAEDPKARVAEGTHPQKYQETPLLIIEKRVGEEQARKALSQVPDGLKQNAEKSIPLILDALRQEGIDYEDVFAFALATAEYEANFDPGMREHEGRKQARRLNYEGGEDFYGRGLIMLTHRKNYAKYGQYINLDLVNNPDLALRPYISARILAAFFRLERVADLIRQGRYEEARKRIVGDYDEDDTYNKQITKYIINRTNSYLRSMRQ